MQRPRAGTSPCHTTAERAEAKARQRIDRTSSARQGEGKSLLSAKCRIEEGERRDQRPARVGELRGMRDGPTVGREPRAPPVTS